MSVCNHTLNSDYAYEVCMVLPIPTLQLKMKLRRPLQILLVAAVAGICSCQQDCVFPTNDDLEVVIGGIFISGDSPTPPVINVMRFHPVCLAFGEKQDRYRYVSVVVEYTCTGKTNCPPGTAVEQIEFQCSVGGMWSNSVQGSTENTRTVDPQASFSTTTREDCVFCLSPERSGTLSTDDVTHCVGECVSLLTFHGQRHTRENFTKAHSNLLSVPTYMCRNVVSWSGTSVPSKRAPHTTSAHSLHVYTQLQNIPITL